MKALFLVTAGILMASLAFGLAMETTIETLNYELDSPEQLAKWMKENLRYREFANDGDDDRYACLKTGTADCDDYSFLSYEFLRRKPYYSPEVVAISKGGGRGHVITLYFGAGWQFFSNANLVSAPEAKTYQDIAEAYSDEWKSIVVFDDYGMRKHKIFRDDDPVRLGA